MTNIPSPFQIFISYAYEDEQLKNQLVNHLSSLKRLGFISTWTMQDIKAGEKWKHTIDEHLQTADVILLLISPDFIASDYCYSSEMMQAMKRHEIQETCVIPIILRPIYLGDEPFMKLRVLPSTGLALTSWKNMDEAFIDVIKGINERITIFLHSIKKEDNDEKDNLKKSAFQYRKARFAHQDTYIAHPYIMQQTPSLIGRQNELAMLTNWVADVHSELYSVRVLALVALGGMGKSALTWKWFNDIAPQHMQPLAGRVWWSFYEDHASFDEFILKTLHYICGKERRDLLKVPIIEREQYLLSIFDREPFLIVLDGLERLLIAYAPINAASTIDNRLDLDIIEAGTQAYNLPKEAAQTFIGMHRLRKTIDPHVGLFLRKLTMINASRILISTRLYPANLQTSVGREIPGSRAFFLNGLNNDDALNLWQCLGVSGSRKSLLALFKTFENHPLFIQVLAGVIAYDRKTPGDFDRWHTNHPNFDPSRLPLVQARSHILEIALQNINETARNVINVVSAFNRAVSYDVLVDLLVEKSHVCIDESTLILTLTELEDRGLLGWDRYANCYDLHPIIRNVIWSSLQDSDKKAIYETMNKHYQANSQLRSFKTVQSLTEVMPIVEYYNSLIGLGEYHKASLLINDSLKGNLMFDLGATDLYIEIIKKLFPDGLDHFPHCHIGIKHSSLFHDLGLSYKINGNLEQSEEFLLRALKAEEVEQKSPTDALAKYVYAYCDLSKVKRLKGSIYDAEYIIRQALKYAKRQYELNVSLINLGEILALRGMDNDSGIILEKALMFIEKRIDASGSNQAVTYEGRTYMAIAQRLLWLNQSDVALTPTQTAWEDAVVVNHKRDCIRAARLQASVLINLNKLDLADERLRYALPLARETSFVEEELLIIIEKAKLKRLQGYLTEAREMLEAFWEVDKYKSMRLLQADAYNLLAQIEREAGNTVAAIEAALKSYTLSWCDGPPFAYHWGLEKAKAHLEDLKVSLPILTKFDQSKYAPMPVEIPS